MQRFLITHKSKFAGQAELVFNDKGILSVIDCSQTDMDEYTIGIFKLKVPTRPSLLASSFGEETTIVESGITVTFEMFYKDYPLKRNRYKAEKAFAKLNDTDKITAFYSLHAYKKYLNKNAWQTPMIADTYLTRKEFETEWNKLK